MGTTQTNNRVVGVIALTLGSVTVLLSVLAIVLMIRDGYALVAIMPAIAVVFGVEIFLAGITEFSKRRVYSLRPILGMRRPI